MTESIFLRARRIVSAGVGTAVEAAERLTGASVMRQAVRDMDGAIDEMRKRENEARRRRAQAEAEQRIGVDRAATLREQARSALVAGRDDLAEAAVAEQVTVEERLERLAEAEAEAAADEARCAEAVTTLGARRRKLEQELKAHEAVADGVGRVQPNKVERRAERAEEAFGRAAVAVGRTRAELDAGNTARVGEIEALRRERTIADRVAELRAGLESGAEQAAVKKRGGRRS